MVNSFFLALMFIIILIVGAMIALFLSSILLVPAVMTPIKIVKEVLGAMDLNEKSRLLDLGSGDGRVLVFAKKLYGVKGVGYEISPLLVLYSRLFKLRHLGLSRGVVNVTGNLFDADFGSFDRIFAHLNRRALGALQKKLILELQPGSIFYSYRYPLPNFQPTNEFVLSNGVHLYAYTKDSFTLD